MSTLTPYRDKTVLSTVEDWWDQTYPNNKATKPNVIHPDGWFEREPVTILHLYQSYCEYTLALALYPSRLDLNQFAKCLVACHILDIGTGSWVRSDEWQPKEYELRRANGDVSIGDHYQFLGQVEVRERLSHGQ